MQECHLNLDQIGDLTLVQYETIIRELERQDEEVEKQSKEPGGGPASNRLETKKQQQAWVRSMHGKGIGKPKQ